MICLWKTPEVLFSSHLSWVISLSLYSQVYCGLMLFNVILIWKGEFLNFDCSVSPSRRGKSRTSGWWSIYTKSIYALLSHFIVWSLLCYCVRNRGRGERGIGQDHLTFSKRLLSNSLPLGKNVRSNITQFPTPRNDLWSPARKKIQISLPLGQQENSNALPPGQSDQFSICTNPIIHLFYPPKFCVIIVYNFSWDMNMSQGKSKTMPMQIFGW